MSAPLRNPEIRALRGPGASGIAGEAWLHRGDVVAWLHAAADGVRELGDLDEPLGPLTIDDVAAAIDVWAEYLLGVATSATLET